MIMISFIKKILVALVVVLMAVSVQAHEGDYVHMPETSGGIVFMKECGYHVTVGIDDNGNGEVDRCIGTFLDHDMFHVVPVEFKLIDGKVGCGCSGLTTGNGGAN
jgi:hypothetical protein